VSVTVPGPAACTRTNGTWPLLRDSLLRTKIASGKGKVPFYRLYPIGKDGRVASAPLVVECLDDKAAIEEAKLRADGFPIEIWESTRKVALVEPHRPGDDRFPPP
jgi:hypothetical protein